MITDDRDDPRSPSEGDDDQVRRKTRRQKVRTRPMPGVSARLSRSAPAGIAGRPDSTAETLEPWQLKAAWERRRPEDARDRILVVDGERPWRIVELELEQTVFGRDPDCDVVLESHDVSRRHAVIRRTDDGLFIEDLGSSNGTFVDCIPIRRSEIRHGTVVFIGSAMLKLTAPTSADDVFYESLYEASRRDPLTRLPNRQVLIDRLRLELESSSPDRVGLILVDVDSFKEINDRHGHPVGDVVLRSVADILRAHVREHDVVVRYGGDEFAILVRRTSPADLARLSSALRGAVGDRPLATDAGAVDVSITVGHAVWSLSMTSEEQLVAAADAELYRTKRTPPS